MMNMKKHTLLAAAILAALNGCAVSRVNQSSARIDDNAVKASTEMTTLSAAKPRSIVQFSDSPWVDTTPVKIVKPLYQAPQLACNVTYAPEDTSTILEFSQRVSRLCGIPVRVTPDAQAVLSGSSSSSSGGTMGATGAIPSLPSVAGIPSLPGVDSSSGMSFSGSSVSRGSISDLKYSGPLQGLLDAATSRLGVSWRFENGGVNIFYLDTQVFSLLALPSITETKSSVQSGTSTSAGSSGSTSGSSGGTTSNSGSSQSTDVSMKTDLIEDIKNNIKSMLTPSVGRLNVSASTGAITVTDTPDVLTRIGSYLEHENQSITQQIQFNVKVLSVSLNDSDEGSINWNLVNAAGAKFGGSLANSSSLVSSTDAVSGSVNVLSGKWADSSLLIKALSEQGRVSTVTTQSVTTLNLQPSPVQVATQQSYLASISTTTTDSSTATSMTPGTVTTGFNMSLLPYVMTGTQDMLLQYSVNLSSLNSLDTFSSNGSTIQLPNIDNRIFSQRVKIRSGQTLILSGFEQTTDSTKKQGVGSPNNILFGGAMSGSKDKQVIVIAITPVLMG